MKLRGFLLAVLVSLSFASPAFAGISDSKHNLGSTGSGNSFDGTGEICVFCHTPHGGDTSAPVPLWNRDLGTNTYQTYDDLGTSSLDGAVATVGSVSIACLSCHDGTQALDSVINQPGSGLVNSGFEAGSWSGNIDPDGTLGDNIITNIGTDLRNDHPIGIQYGGGGITSGQVNGNTNDADFWQPTPVVVSGAITTWYIEASGNGARDKEDVILFSRPSGDFGGGSTVEPSVECASCHDPHTTVNPTFLRVTNVGSQICLTCHNK